jgi:hypothetical protein
VRELKRQIVTLYFERSGLAKDKEKLAAMVRKEVETAEPKLAIRDPYIFEFLGLRAKDAMADSDLEAALVEHLCEFLLELGHGFLPGGAAEEHRHRRQARVCGSGLLPPHFEMPCAGGVEGG